MSTKSDTYTNFIRLTTSHKSMSCNKYNNKNYLLKTTQRIAVALRFFDITSFHSIVGNAGTSTHGMFDTIAFLLP